MASPNPFSGGVTTPPHQPPQMQQRSPPTDRPQISSPELPPNPFDDNVRPENVALEFVNQSSIGANAQSAADFFQNMRIGDDPFEGPAYTSSISAFNPQTWAERMEGLRTSSIQHAHTLTTKQRWEHEAIEMHNGAWRFVSEQRRATGVCGCGNNVTYSFAIRVANLNDNIMPLLNNKFQDLHHFNTRPVYLSLFEQTINEMAVTRYLYSCKHLVAGKYQELKAILEQIFIALSGARDTTQGVMSMHTTNVLQTLAQYFGTLLLQSAQNNVNIPSLLVDLGEVNDNQSLPKYAASELLFKKLLEVHGFSWGCALVHPSIREVIEMSYLHQLMESSLDEIQYIAFMEQITWTEVSTLTEAELTTSFYPAFQKGMDKAVRGNMPKLLILFSKILTLIAHYHPRLTLQSLALMTRSPWPSKILTSPLLAALSWSPLTAAELELVFVELYHLFGKRISVDYLPKPDSEKALHRHSMGHMMLANQHLLTQAYQLDPSLAGLNYAVRFPHLALFRRLALHHLRVTGDNNNEQIGDLPGVIMDELFYFGFVYQGLPVGSGPGPSNPPPPPDLPAWLPYLKNEASVQLGLLCRASPRLSSRMVRLIGQNIGSVNPSQVLSFLNQTPTPPLVHSGLSSEALNWISFLISQKALPVTGNAADTPQTIDAVINLCLFTPIRPQMPPQVAQVALQIGLKLLESVKWEQVPPGIRMKALLVVLASRPVARDWAWKFLLLPSNRKLTSAPFDTVFVHKLFQVDAIQAGDELLLAQILLALGMADDQYRTQPTGGADWLNKWGLYNKLSTLIERKRVEWVLSLLYPVIGTLKMEPELTSPLINNVLTKLLSENHETVDGVNRVMMVSLSDGSPPETHEQWVKMWAIILSQKVLSYNGFIGMLESLITGFYFERAGDFTPILPYLTIEANKKNISKFSGKYPYITLALLHKMSPRLPPVRAIRDVDKVTKETALWLIKEEAQNIKSPVLALVYWEAFFHFYFEAALGTEPLPPVAREALNKHFNNVVNNAKSLNETLVSVYYSFTTWRDTILFQNGRIFSNPVTWEALAKSLPPPPYTLGAPVTPPHHALQHAQQLFTADLEYISGLSSDLDNAKLLALLPLRRVDPMTLVESENTRHQSFTQSVSSTLAALEKDDPKVRAIDDLNKLLRRYTTLKNNLMQEDAEFLQLTNQLYFNHPSTFQVSVPCGSSGYCDYPAQIKCAGVNIGPAYPSVRDDIQRNRGLFNRDYVAIFDVARSIAYIVALLEETVLQQLSSTAGIQLFFALSPILLESLPPPNSPIFSALARVVLALGEKFVKNNPHLQRKLLQMIVSKSVKGGEGALVTVKSTSAKAFNELRTSVFESFSPTCLLQNDDGIQNYMELLYMFVSSTNGLAPAEDKQIASLFAVGENFDLIMARNPHAIDTILSMTQALLCKQSLNALAVEILTLVINYQFPRYFEPVLERLLTLSVQKLITTPWTDLLEPLTPQITSLDEAYAIQLLKKATQYIPTPTPFFTPILLLAQRLLQHPGITQGILEGRPGYWELVMGCLSAATKPNSVYFPLSSPDFGSVLGFIRDMILMCPVLVDRVWDLYCTVLLPYLVIDKAADKMQVLRLMDEIPASTWAHATFHTHPSAVREMSSHMSGAEGARGASIVCKLISKLDWRQVTTRRDSATLLAVLQMYLCASVIQGGDVFGESSRESVRRASWGILDEDELRRQFRGDLFIRLLKDGTLNDEDSSKPIMDALQQLYEFADNSNSLPLAAACIREARAFVLASFRSDDTGAYWALPLADQVTIVSTILIPLARKATQRSPSSIPPPSTHSSLHQYPNLYTREMLEALLSTASQNWSNPITAPIGYAVDSQSHSEQAQSGSPIFQDFHRKVDGLVLQFCSSSPTELAISILQAAIDARLDPDTHMRVLEESLHSYFIHAHSDAEQEATEREMEARDRGEDTGEKGKITVSGVRAREIVVRAAHSLTLPTDHEWNEFLERCIAGHAILTTRMLLEKQRLHIGNMPSLQWIGFATDLVVSASRCVPTSNRMFDIFCLWFFALDIIMDQRWIGGKKAEEATKNFHKHLSLFTSSLTLSHLSQFLPSTSSVKVGAPATAPSQQSQLAARACLLFLERISSSKRSSKAHDVRSGAIRMGDMENDETNGAVVNYEMNALSINNNNNNNNNFNNNFNNDDGALLHHDVGSKKDRELFDMAEKLYALRTDPANAGFEEFFAQMQNILSPLFDFNHFRSTLVRSLAPIALYLEML